MVGIAITKSKAKKELIPTAQAELLGQFSETRDTKEIIEVLNQLFDKQKIPMITDLSEDEIKLITAINIVADLKDLKAWEKGVDLYMTLLLSKKRKSRREVIDAVKGFTEKMRGLRGLLQSDRNR